MTTGCMLCRPLVRAESDCEQQQAVWHSSTFLATWEQLDTEDYEISSAEKGPSCEANSNSVKTLSAFQETQGFIAVIPTLSQINPVHFLARSV